MAQIEIVPVEGLSRFTTFCKLPRLLYRGMSGFVPPLDVERWTLFAHRLNPHYKLVEEQKFLARRDGQWVGRIAAQIYKDVIPVGASPAQFGALDAIDDIDVVRALLAAAEDWLRARGAERILEGRNEAQVAAVTHEAGPLLIVAGAGTDGNHFAFLRLFLGGVGDDDAALGLLFAFESLDHNPVVQGTKRHCKVFLFCAGDGGPPHRRMTKRMLLALSDDEC